MQIMFQYCSVITDLDLSSFNTEKVTNMSYMFHGCTSLRKLDIRNFDFTKVTSMGNFLGSTSDSSSKVPSDCLIIVKDDTAKS